MLGGAAKHRLVSFLQTVLIERDIPGSVDRSHARQGFGCRAVNTDHPRVWAPGEQDLHVEHISSDEIAGVQGCACDLVTGIDAGDGFADGSCHNFPMWNKVINDHRLSFVCFCFMLGRRGIQLCILRRANQRVDPGIKKRCDRGQEEYYHEESDDIQPQVI